jgi:hypothetical protein
VLLLRDLKVSDVRVLKGAHLKVRLTDSRRAIDAVWWRQTSHPALVVGSKVNVAAKPDSNAYQGNLSVQITLQAAEAL